MPLAHGFFPLTYSMGCYILYSDQEMEKMKELLDALEIEFWNDYPHEIDWFELKEINPELWCRLQNIGQALVLNNRLLAAYLK